jgi:antitoxin component YwqK of YwqJK toxin-antitoxin module
MALFSYHSRHKIITGAFIVAWAVWHFWQREEPVDRYPNGQVICSGGRKENLNHGLWTWYYENGRKKMEGQFEIGQREGRWVTLGPTGDTLHVAHYSNDRLNGMSTSYGTDGRPFTSTLYTDDAAQTTVGHGH